MTCSFEGCDKEPYSKGLCKGHYNQQNRGVELTPLRSRGQKVQSVRAEDLPCIVDGCEAHQYSKNLCRNHYMQEWRKQA